MNNSRSQTKIRKTQTLNLVAEQRYLKNKGLLRESSDDFMECFDQLGLTMDQLPARCMSITTKEDFVACKNEINQFVMQSKQNLVPMLQKFFTCMEGKAQNMGILFDTNNTTELDLEDELESKKTLAQELFSEEEYADLLERLLAAETLEEFYAILDEEGETLPED
jgi:hypothetical protein